MPKIMIRLRKQQNSCYHVVFMTKDNSDMSSSPALPSYKKLAALFKKIKSDLDPSQTHGLMCGHLCVTPSLDDADPKFDKALLDVEGNKQSEAILTELYKASYHSLKQFSFEFSLILPDDKTDLNLRVEALGLWCQGFITGIEPSIAKLKTNPEKDVTEALSDLVEISQINFGDIPENEEDETAYFELVEYTRLSALMLFNTIQSEKPVSRQQDTMLH